MASASENIPINAIQACYSRERRLFSRMVLNLNMDIIQSMLLIAFWLWLEEREQKDFINSIISFSDSNLRSIALIGRDFITALRLDTPPDQLQTGFHQTALQGIGYYLNTVCMKAFSDIRLIAEERMKLLRMEMLVHQMSRSSLDNQPYVPHGEGPSNRVSNANFEPHSILDVEMGIQSAYPFNLSMLGQGPLVPRDAGVGHGLPIMPQNTNRSHYQGTTEGPQPPRDNIQIEDRTLFVTFSNGYPLTKEQLFNFFMRHFGDVELVNLQAPKKGKPPQYAYVSFYRLETLFRVLNGSHKAKFICNGRHLWARRFIPKRNQSGEIVRKGFRIV